MTPMALGSRFWDKVDRHGPVFVDAGGINRAECWVWTAHTATGYGHYRYQGRKRYAHVLAFEEIVGPLPAGHERDHLCRNKRCLRADPDPHRTHLEAVTHAENMRRGNAGADHAAKTHCPRGHPYDEQNTYRLHGERYCKECKRVWNRAYRERRRDNAR